MDLVGADGVISVVAPDTLASASSYAALRAAYRVAFPMQDWVAVEGRAFRAQVGSVVLTASRGPRCLTAGVVRVAPGGASGDACAVVTPQCAARGDEERILRFVNSADHDIWKCINAAPKRMGAVARIHDGVNTGPRAVRDRLLSPTVGSPHRRPLVEGCDIDRRGYQPVRPRRWIDYDENRIDAAGRRGGASLRDAAIFDAPKVLTRQTAETLIAGIDPTGRVVALNSVHCWRMPGDDPELLWGLVGFLNSKPVRVYYALDGGEQRAILPQVRIAWLRRMPVPGEFMSLLMRLAWLAREVAAARESDVDAENLELRVDAEVFDAYGIPTRFADALSAAYRRYFPRVAQAGSVGRSAQVA